ncbi:hypothetical protein [Klebsiella grimontii]|uniref:hypothetical protein n=1 Tax=Klebsiella grimontii TaxID=2058152 RepID=UPI0039FCB583
MTITLHAVNELIQSLESAGELSIKETKVMALAKAYLDVAAENVVRQEFVKICFRAAADGASLDGSDIQEIGERLGLFGRETYQPMLHGYICGHEAGEDSVYVMKSTPVTDRIVSGIKADGRVEGINFAAGRLAAAFNHGFVDKSMAEVFDVVRMILTAKEDLANNPAEDGLSGEYAEKSLAEWEAALREGAK